MLCSDLITALAMQIKAEGDIEVKLRSTLHGSHFDILSLTVGSYIDSGSVFVIEAADVVDCTSEAKE